MESGVDCSWRLLAAASHRESEGNVRSPRARVPAVWAADRTEPGRRASNHSAAVVLDNSVPKVKSTVPDILQMPHNGSN